MPEVRRLLQVLAIPGAAAQRRRWAGWRRAHQAGARRSHRTRRARAQPPEADVAVPVVAVPGTPALTDAAWAALAELLAGPPRRGKRHYAQRAVLAGILWIMHTGASWREVPPTFGPWHTVYDRYRRWREDETWPRILAVLEAPTAQDTS